MNTHVTELLRLIYHDGVDIIQIRKNQNAILEAGLGRPVTSGHLPRTKDRIVLWIYEGFKFKLLPSNSSLGRKARFFVKCPVCDNWYSITGFVNHAPSHNDS